MKNDNLFWIGLLICLLICFSCKAKENPNLIDAVKAGSKLTKADAGYRLD